MLSWIEILHDLGTWYTYIKAKKYNLILYYPSYYHFNLKKHVLAPKDK